MNPFRPYVFRLVSGLFGVLLLVKLYVRPWVVSGHGGRVFEVLVQSFPSFVESVVIFTLIFVIMTFLHRLPLPVLGRATESAVVAICLLLTAWYTVTQELQVQNLGGYNTVDPWDVGASISGLVLMTVLFVYHGFWKPSAATSTHPPDDETAT